MPADPQPDPSDARYTSAQAIRDMLAAQPARAGHLPPMTLDELCDRSPAADSDAIARAMTAADDDLRAAWAAWEARRGGSKTNAAPARRRRDTGRTE